jgi:hypothetical protein
MGGWVSPIAGLGAVKKRKISFPCLEPNRGRPSCSSSLYRLNYSGSYPTKLLGTNRGIQNAKVQRIQVETVHSGTDGICWYPFITRCEYSDVIRVFTDSQEERGKNRMNKNNKERKYRRGTRFVGATIVKDTLYNNYCNSTRGQVTDHMRSSVCFVPMQFDLQQIPGTSELGYSKHEVYIPPLPGNLHHLPLATNYVRITESEPMLPGTTDRQREKRKCCNLEYIILQHCAFSFCAPQSLAEKKRSKAIPVTGRGGP